MTRIPSREDRLLPSAVKTIGNTPLVELSRLTRDLAGRILAKLESPYSKTVLKNAKYMTLSTLPYQLQ